MATEVAIGTRHYSGLLVTARSSSPERCRADLEGLPGVEVHFVYPDSGRLIAVQEGATAKAQEEGLRRIQALPSVRVAALVEHRIDDGNEANEEEETG